MINNKNNKNNKINRNSQINMRLLLSTNQWEISEILPHRKTIENKSKIKIESNIEDKLNLTNPKLTITQETYDVKVNPIIFEKRYPLSGNCPNTRNTIGKTKKPNICNTIYQSKTEIIS